MPRRAAIAQSGKNISESTQSQLHAVLRERREPRGAEPEGREQIIAAAKQSFLDGDQWAYLAAMVAVVIGGAVIFFLFPKSDEEETPPRRLPRGGSAAPRP